MFIVGVSNWQAQRVLHGYADVQYGIRRPHNGRGAGTHIAIVGDAIHEAYSLHDNHGAAVDFGNQTRQQYPVPPQRR